MCKKMKKCLSVLSLVCFMSVVLLSQSLCASAADVALAKETFDSSVLSNCWEYGSASGVENGVFKSGGTNWNTLSFTPSSNIVVYRFKFMHPEIITTDLCRALNSTGGTIAFRVYASNGDIYLERNDGAVKLFAGYATNTWYDICVIAPGDGAAGTAYVNGTASGNFYNIASPGNYAKMQTFNRESGITYFDDIEINAYPSRAAANIAVNAENHTISNFNRYGAKGADNLKKVVDEYRYVISDDEATSEELTKAQDMVTDAMYGANDYLYQSTSDAIASSRSFSPINKVAVIETNFSLRAGGYTIRAQQVWNAAGSGRAFVLYASTSGNGSLVLDNGTSHTLSDNVPGGQWNNLISVIDIENERVCVYFNGNLVFDGVGFKNDIFDIGRVEIQTENIYTECIIGGPVLAREFDDFDAVCAYIEAENELDRGNVSSKNGYAELKGVYNAVDTAYIWHGDYATAANNLKTALADFKDNNFAISSKFTDGDGNFITKLGTNESVVAKIEATHCDNTKKPTKLFVVKYVGDKMDSIKIFETINSFKGESTSMSATIPVEAVSGESYKIFVWNDSIVPVIEASVID